MNKNVEKELKRIIKGEVLFDEITRNIYSTGASIYKIKPEGVVIPKDKEDVISLVEYIKKEGIPIIPRGACSSLAGQAIGAGIVVDFTKYMNEIIEVNEEFVRVQPGLIYGKLNKRLKSFDRIFLPDPSSGDFCTIGGMIGCNAGGAHSIKYKSTNEQVESLEVVLASGELINIEKYSINNLKNIPLANKIFDIISRNELLIGEHTPKVKRNACGYNLDIIKGEILNLPKLLVGSEGTLGIITEATLRITKPLKHKIVALLDIGSLGKLASSIEQVLEFSPSAIELMDEFFLNLVKEFDPSLRPILPELSQALLLIELEGEDKDEVRQRAENMKQKYPGKNIQIAYNLVEQERLWKIRQAAVPIINRVKGIKRPVPFIEDVIVPINKLGECINQLHQIFAENEVEACIYGHAGDGNLHIRPRLNLKDNKDIHKMKVIADAVYSLVISFKGSMSAEHGAGLLRTPYLSKQYGQLTSLFREVKKVFDTQNILNPGKIVDLDESFVHDLIYGWNFNYTQTSSNFDKPHLKEEIEKCHGCAQCRNICPVVMTTLEEITSPRAKATLLRAILSGDLEVRFLLKKQFKEIFDLCLNCRACLWQCPTQVNIPQLVIEAKNYYISKMGQMWYEQIIQEPKLLGKISSILPRLTNLLTQSKIGKIILEATLGLSAKRILPKISPQPLTKQRQRKNQKEIKIAYFYGCFANFYSVEDEGLPVITILEHNGIEVILPEQRCCGGPKITEGNLEAVYEDIRYNIKHLSQAILSGYQVVTTCPTCCLILKVDYPYLMKTHESNLVAQNTSDIHEFLWRLFTTKRLNTDFKPLSKKLIYHHPCHLSAIGIKDLPVKLLQLIPEINLVEIEDSCCGMGGILGLKKERFEWSMKIGEGLFQQIKNTNPNAVITPCAACKMQIEQATNIKVYHPIKILEGCVSTKCG